MPTTGGPRVASRSSSLLSHLSQLVSERVWSAKTTVHTLQATTVQKTRGVRGVASGPVTATWPVAAPVAAPGAMTAQHAASTWIESLRDRFLAHPCSLCPIDCAPCVLALPPCCWLAGWLLSQYFSMSSSASCVTNVDAVRANLGGPLMAAATAAAAAAAVLLLLLLFDC